MTDLTNIEVTALNNLVAAKVAKTARDGVSPGEHAVDFTVRVTGTVKVLADTDKTSTVSIPVKEVLALFIQRSGCTREHSLALLRECLTDALSASTEGKGAIEGAIDLDAEFKAAVADLTASLPRTPVKGAVKASLAVEVVENAADALAAK